MWRWLNKARGAALMQAIIWTDLRLINCCYSSSILRINLAFMRRCHAKTRHPVTPNFNCYYSSSTRSCLYFTPFAEQVKFIRVDSEGLFDKETRSKYCSSRKNIFPLELLHSNVVRFIAAACPSLAISSPHSNANRSMSVACSDVEC